MNLKILALFPVLLFAAACSDEVETKEPRNIRLKGDSCNFYKIEKDEMNDFRTKIFHWASSSGFSEISESKYPLELKRNYGDSSSSSVILEPLEAPYYKLWEVINFSGSKMEVDEIHDRYIEGSKTLFKTLESFSAPPEEAPKD